MRSAMVNNETFAVMAVRAGFHRYLKHESHHLSLTLDRFVRTQQGNGHAVLHNVMTLPAVFSISHVAD